MKLLPLLGLYLACTAFWAQGTLRGDEGRYILNAHNLLKGFLASPETLMFWNGPGYPLYLAPFAALKVPWMLPRLGNAVFLFFAIAHFQGALRMLGIEKRSLAYAYAMGLFLLLHGPVMEMFMTESLCAFLVSGAAYHFLRLIREPSWSVPQSLLVGLHLGYLALTKVFFGLVLEASLAASLGLWALGVLLRTKNTPAEAKQGAKAAEVAGAPRAAATEGMPAAKVTPAAKGAASCALALAFCLPYLFHTYTVTRRFPYWGNSGGQQLYCMTLPEKEFVGDWLNFDAVLTFQDFFASQVGFFEELAKMDYISRDDAFKKAAVDNIRKYPRKYFQNWRANVNRMVFGYPVTHYPGADSELATGNRSFVYALPFMLSLMALVPAWRGRKLIPIGVHYGLGFALISLVGLSLLSAIPRMVFPVLPLLGLWLIAVAEKSISVRGRWNAPEG